jgi:hypothetical protein
MSTKKTVIAPELFTWNRTIHPNCFEVVNQNGEYFVWESQGDGGGYYLKVDSKLIGLASLYTGCYGESLIWAKRIVNVLNYVNGGNIAVVADDGSHAKGVISWDRYSIFVDPQHCPADEEHFYIKVFFIDNCTWVGERKIERLLPDNELRAAYLANPCRETAWAAFVGGNPEDWD